MLNRSLVQDVARVAMALTVIVQSGCTTSNAPNLNRTNSIKNIAHNQIAQPNKTAAERVPSNNKRIVGGTQTEIRNHPWQVGLGEQHGQKRRFLCGGTLISQNWVLTAAHCFRFSTGSRNVFLKSNVTNVASEGKWQKVDQVHAHPRYDSKTHEHDLALLRLPAPAAGRSIPLASVGTKIKIGQSLEVTGWGTTSEEGDAADHLRKANVPYVSATVCNRPASYNGRVRSGMICAGKKDGGIDACQGDSGGPLVWRTQAGPILVGVVSFGDGCARKLKYGVYTRVSRYREWIAKTIADNGI